MTLQEYLDQCATEPSSAILENEWLSLASLPVRSGKLAIFDPTLFDGPVVLIPSGDYDVSVTVRNENHDARIARLRVSKGDVGELGFKIAEVGVDFGQIGVGDADAIYSAAETLTEAGQQEVIASMDTMSLFGSIPWDGSSGAMMPWVVSGFGDGCYPVLELVRAGERAGVEIIFLGYEEHLREVYQSRFATYFPAFARFVASGQAGLLGDIEPPMSQQEIAHHESQLGVPLPVSFKQFLSITSGISIQGGTMRIGGEHPFWFDFGPHENLQDQGGEVRVADDGSWPPQSHGMLCFADFWMEGDGDQVLFDAKGGLIDGEYPVWYWDHECPAAYQIASGFREWLENIVTGGKINGDH